MSEPRQTSYRQTFAARIHKVWMYMYIRWRPRPNSRPAPPILQHVRLKETVHVLAHQSMLMGFSQTRWVQGLFQRLYHVEAHQNGELWLLHFSYSE